MGLHYSLTYSATISEIVFTHPVFQHPENGCSLKMLDNSLDSFSTVRSFENYIKTYKLFSEAVPCYMK